VEGKKCLRRNGEGSWWAEEDNKGGSRFICVVWMLKACRLCGVAPESQKSSYA
jgi:hypothetical protein